VVYFGCAVLLAVTFIDQKNSKLLGGVWILFISTVAAFNTSIADRTSYYNMYIRIGRGSFITERVEIGFRYLVKWGNAIGLDKEAFFFIIFVITLTLFYISFSRYVKKSNIIFLFYLLFPFGIDAAQIRTMLSNAMVIYAVWYLREFSIKNIVRYLCIIILATLIHNSALFFVVLCVCYLVRDRWQFFLYNIIAVIICYIIFSRSILMDLASKVIINSAGFSYISETSGSLRFYGYVLCCLVLIGFYEYCRRCNRIENVEQKKYINMIYYINIMSIWSGIFVYFNNNFTRLIRVFVILNYILLQMFLENERSCIRVKFSKSIFYLAGILFCVVLLIVTNSSNMDTTYGALLNGCELFGR
jgi:hypothetical protein